MKFLHLVLAMLLTSSIIVMPSIYSEDEYEDDEKGTGLMQREQEREREHDEDNIALGSDIGNIILYGTIAAIIISIGYTAFKIMSSKRKPNTTMK